MAVRRTRKGKPKKSSQQRGKDRAKKGFSGKVTQVEAKARAQARAQARAKRSRSRAAKKGQETRKYNLLRAGIAKIQEDLAKQDLILAEARREQDLQDKIKLAKENLAKAEREIQEYKNLPPLRGLVPMDEFVARQREDLAQGPKLATAKLFLDVARAGGTGEERVKESEKFAQEVTLGRELQELRLENFYSREKLEDKVKKIDPRRVPGKNYKREGQEQIGHISSRYSGKLLDAQARENIADKASKIAERLLAKLPGGKLYATFTFYEYGRGNIKSGEERGKDDLGKYFQTFDSLGSRFGKNMGRAEEERFVTENPLEFEMRVRELLLDHATDINASILDSWEVKVFRDKTEPEKKSYRRRMRIKRKKAREQEKTRVAESFVTQAIESLRPTKIKK